MLQIQAAYAHTKATLPMKRIRIDGHVVARKGTSRLRPHVFCVCSFRTTFFPKTRCEIRAATRVLCSSVGFDRSRRVHDRMTKQVEGFGISLNTHAGSNRSCRVEWKKAIRWRHSIKGGVCYAHEQKISNAATYDTLRTKTYRQKNGNTGG